MRRVSAKTRAGMPFGLSMWNVLPLIAAPVAARKVTPSVQLAELVLKLLACQWNAVHSCTTARRAPQLLSKIDIM